MQIFRALFKKMLHLYSVAHVDCTFVRKKDSLYYADCQSASKTAATFLPPLSFLPSRGMSFRFLSHLLALSG